MEVDIYLYVSCKVILNNLSCIVCLGNLIFIQEIENLFWNILTFIKAKYKTMFN